MHIEHLLTIPCTITKVTHSGADEYGDAEEATSTIRTTCWYDRPGYASGASAREGWTVNTLVAYFPPGTVLTAADRVTIDSEVYELDGPAHGAFNPFARRVDYVTAALRRVT